MKKKIYAVRRGRTPGIYYVWKETEQQVKGFSHAEYRSFTYMTEREHEDETVEMSLAYALKQAKAYLGAIPEIPEQEEAHAGTSAKVPEQTEVHAETSTEAPEQEETHAGTSTEVPEQAEAHAETGTETPEQEDAYIDADTEVSEQEKDPYHAIEKEVIKREAASDSHQEILELARLKPDAYGNSPWVAALLKCAADKDSFVNSQTYTGRYSCTSLYTALLYLILDDDKLLYTYQRRVPGFDTDDDCIQNIWHESEDYTRLKKRFDRYKMEAIDLPEILCRNQTKAKADGQADVVLGTPSKSYLAMKRFIKQGQHTVMGLYRELVRNPVYRQELLKISGPFRNPDLETNLPSKTTEEATASMQDLIMQTSAVGIALKSKVIGQNDVIDKLEESYFHTEKIANAGRKKKGPRSVYLFAGPPGVGKTFIAEIMAHTLNIPYKRFDMSAYSHPSSAEELIGISNFWNKAKPGVLTDFVRENPRCILLFDEIEKACRDVILLFLQILDEGKCFDRFHDENIDFGNTMIILTTNAGKQLYQDSGNENLTLLPDTVILDALKKDTNPHSDVPFFPPEIVSRMSSHTILMFNHLRADAILKIITADLDKQLKLSKETYGYDIEDGKETLAATALYSMGGNPDARNATVLAGKLIDRGLHAFLTLTEEKLGLDWRNRIRKITWEHDFSGASDEIRQFYFGEKDCVIAIFGQTEKINAGIFTKNNVQIKATTNPEEFLQIIRKEPVILAAVDYEYGRKEKERGLSIADSLTEGSRVFSYLKKEYEETIPVYLLYGDKGYSYSQREKDELCRCGAQGFLQRENIQTELLKAYTDLCCQQTMETLSLRHQRLTYDLRNELDEKQKSGRIVFCNFKLESSVEAEDKDLLLSADMRPDKHWDDIFVSDDVKKELEFFIDFLKNPKEYIQKGVRIPKGVLMYGPAGTGKTSLAKVVAAESDVSFLEIGADTLRTRGADEVRRVFRTARKYAPAVLFLDEVDAIGADRQQAVGNIALNTLLTEMDGFKRVDDKPIFIMAATNLVHQIDPALLRRFDRTFEIRLPDDKGRKWMLKRLLGIHSTMFQISDKEIDSITDRSAGMNFAQMENIIETALREAIRADKPVDDTLLDETFEKCNLGEARETGSLEVMKRTAYHESGHALVQLFHKKIPDYMSVVARSQFGGYVRRKSTPDEYFTKESLLERIRELLGGRAAEIVCGYGLTCGASNDLKCATELASDMVCNYGMYQEEIGLAVISEKELACHEKAKNLVNQILSEQLQEAMTIIRHHKDALERLVSAVMDSEKKYLTKKEIEAAYRG